MQTTSEKKKEFAAKADAAAKNIKHAVNKKLAVHQFLTYLYFSI